MRALVPCSLALILTAPGFQAMAQDTGPTPPPGVQDISEPTELSFGVDAGLGFSSIASDGFIETIVGFTVAYEKLEAAIQALLRFRVIDEPPSDDGVLRGQDWDEPSDCMRILRYVRWSNRNDTYFVRGGELVDVHMGHGTIVGGYHNFIDPNHFQWGIDGAANFRFGGLELLIDNVVSAEVMGLRTYVRPWSFIEPDSYWSRLAFGITFAGDRDAPDRLFLDDVGEYVINSEGNILVERRTETGVLGIDAELQAFTSESISVTPYADANFHLGYGAGLHIGALSNFTFSEDVGLNTRLEFRALGKGYTAEYFDALYELQKFLYRSLDTTGQRSPKLQVLDLDRPDAAVGFLVQATLGIIQEIFLTLGWEDYEESENSSFLARLSIPQLGPVTAGAYFINQDFDGVGDLGNLDNALIATEVRVIFYKPFYAIAQYTRRFTAQEDGTYEATNDWAIGVGASFSFQ